MGFAAASTVDIWASISLGWKKLVLSLSFLPLSLSPSPSPSLSLTLSLSLSLSLSLFLSLSLSLSLCLIYENTLEVHRIRLRCQTFSNSKLSRNCHQMGYTE